MVLTKDISDRIIIIAHSYLDRPFDYEKFNCVHFVREVFCSIRINLPLLERSGHPPEEFHLSIDEFKLMPIGHSVFFRRKATASNRIWTHVAIIASSNELIHCTRRFGGKVVVTRIDEFLEVYALAHNRI